MAHLRQAGNYTYGSVNNITIPFLPITQYSGSLFSRNVWNPILDYLGYLPPFGGIYSPLIFIEIIGYIVAEYNNTLNVFSGLQDNRFRFDTLTQRSRISALLAYTITPPGTFNIVESNIKFNEDDIPSVLY